MVHHLSRGLFVRGRGRGRHVRFCRPRETFRSRGRRVESLGFVDSLAVVERVETPKVRERIVERVPERRGARAGAKRSDADARGEAEGCEHAERGEAAAAESARGVSALDDSQQGGVLVRGHDTAGCVCISRRSSAGPRWRVAGNDDRNGAVPRRSGRNRGRNVTSTRRVARCGLSAALVCASSGGHAARVRNARFQMENGCYAYTIVCEYVRLIATCLRYPEFFRDVASGEAFRQERAMRLCGSIRGVLRNGASAARRSVRRTKGM